MTIVYLDIGSNIDRYNNIQSCIDHLCQDFPSIIFSNAYESEAYGFDGDPFINLSARLETDLDYETLHLHLKKLENTHARKPGGKKYISRTLDIDILLFGNEILYPEKDVPRAEIMKFPFVLFPLSEIAGDVIHPAEKKSISQIVNETKLDINAIKCIDNFPNIPNK